MPSSVDLPTPEPANSPSRCPCRHVVKQFSARTPRSSLGPSLPRVPASGGAARICRSAPPGGKGPRPSRGAPSGSTTRPSHPEETARQAPATGAASGLRRCRTTPLPGPIPSSESNGIASAIPSWKATTSDTTPRPSRLRIKTRSPTVRYWERPCTRAHSPAAPPTWPLNVSAPIACSLARPSRMRGTAPGCLDNLFSSNFNA